MQTYNKGFARVYNMRWGDFANNVAPLIRLFYESTPIGQTNKTLLDVCCGVGHLALHFLEHGYRVTGLDLSPEMLVYARERTQVYMDQGKVTFVEGNAANFTLDATFGLVTSTFDALNHLPTLDDLQGCFRSVAAVLEADGWFVFDLNTRHGLERWGGMTLQETDTLSLSTRGVIVEELGRAYTHISGFFRREDGF
ncbi:MAG: class I SAM-dependent methyltransferase, partial [Anaerolineae bacterium]|nr:class I SAM-dependent methyltransferase [Anaerolineae bacterium]